MTINSSPPDYKFWAAAETWSINQAALLLHGIDPHQHRSLRLAEKNIPAEFLEVQKTYVLLRSVPWQHRHCNYYFPYQGVHPIAVLYEAKTKSLPCPPDLHKLIAQRYAIETELKKEDVPVENQDSISPKEKATQEQPLISRERKNLLKAVGILVKLLIDEKEKSTRSNHGTKISALQILQLMLDKADALGVEIEGLKSFDRKITESLELLDEELV